MGCDIHLFAEAKKKQTFAQKLIFWEKPKWESIENWEIDENFDDKRITVPYGKRFYNGGRNYNLFSALCGVRSFHFNDEPPKISEPEQRNFLTSLKNLK